VLPVWALRSLEGSLSLEAVQARKLWPTDVLGFSASGFGKGWGGNGPGPSVVSSSALASSAGEGSRVSSVPCGDSSTCL